LAGLFILLKTLLQIGLTFGIGECLRCFDLLANGAIGEWRFLKAEEL
jgi:hypothetical protein